MKKIVLTILALSSILSVKAQYFQHLYGTTENEYLSDGHNTNVTGQGHFFVGPSELAGSPFTYNSIDIVRTDLNGTTIFNNNYEISDRTVPPMQNPSLFANEVYSVEMPDGSGFAVAGSYFRGMAGQGAPTSFGFYFYTVDPMGNPLNPYPNASAYTIANGNYIGFRVTKLIPSLNANNQFVILGYGIDAITRRNKAFAIEVDNTGAIIWEQVYDMTSNSTMESDIPYDIVASPYLHPTHGFAEYWIVGEHTDYTSGVGLTDGFILRIQASNGFMLNNNIFYGQQHSKDVFTSITPTSNPNVDPNGEGFVIGGYTDESGNYDAWAMAIDNNQSVAWSNRYNYMVGGMPTANNDYCNDIMERINTSGLSEYYLVGTTDNGVLGNDQDVLVFKIDDNGSLVPNGQFTYGDIDLHIGISIDQIDDPSIGGLVIFAQGFFIPPVGIGGIDHYLIRTYFNGVTDCHQDQQDGEELPGAGELFQDYGDIFETFDTYNINIDINQPQTDNQICFSTSVPGGDNARVAPEEPKGDKQGKLSPNPIAQGTQYASLEVEVTTPTNATVTIYDMLGRTYYTHQFSLVKGKNNLMLNISEANMAAGTYSMRVTGDNLNNTIMLMVK